MQNHKLYLTAAQAQLWDGPVGDPFGGPAYGEKNMPAVPVIAAVAGAVSGVATLAAGATGLAALSAGAMVVGGALTTIGAISGNKKLMKIGGVLSLAGGVGSMASNAMNAAGSASSAAPTGTLGVEAAGNVATEAVNLGGTEAFALPGAETVTSGTEALSGMDMASDAVSAAKAGGDMAVGKGFDSMGLLAEETAKNAAVTAPSTEVVQQGIGADSSAPLQAQAEVTTQSTGSLDAIDPEMQKLLRQQTNAQAGMNFFDQSPSMLSKLQAWVKENPKLAQMALSGVSSMAGAVPSEKDKAMMEYYRQQTENSKRKATWATGRI